MQLRRIAAMGAVNPANRSPCATRSTIRVRHSARLRSTTVAVVVVFTAHLPRVQWRRG
ncbi:hypothetical protein I552_4941 [Mycobacterium xenopi 3993]|nr:hypothetical protein I552_4941 [Mycobacterium xenopi 3993]